MGNIYVASKDVSGTVVRDHLYLVYDQDGIFNNGDERIIRGGPTYDGFLPPFGALTLEIGTVYIESLDSPNLDINNDGLPDTAEDRNFTKLDFSGMESSVWTSWISVANGIQAAEYDYDIASDVMTNSNSVVGTLLSSVGLDIQDVGPIAGGDLSWDGDPNNDVTTGRMDFSTFPGDLSILDTVLNTSFSIFKIDGLIYSSTVFFKVNGIDTIAMEQGAELEIRNVEATDGLTKIDIVGDFEEFNFAMDGDDLGVTKLGWNILSDDVVLLTDYKLYNGINNIEFIFNHRHYRHGTDGNDIMQAPVEAHDAYMTINGFGGNDTLYGNDGDDYIVGGEGIDTVYGGDGDDYFDGHGGSSGLDGDTYDGGDGRDRVDYLELTHGVKVDLSAGTALKWNGTTVSGSEDTLVSIEDIIGTDYNDHLTGNDSDNYFYGGGGADIINGGGGRDSFEVDGLSAQLDGDVFNGGGGLYDYAMYAGFGSGLQFDLRSSSTVSVRKWDSSAGVSGNTDEFTSVEHFRGSAYDDNFIGAKGPVELNGFSGSDTYSFDLDQDSGIVTIYDADPNGYEESVDIVNIDATNLADFYVYAFAPTDFYSLSIGREITDNGSVIFEEMLYLTMLKDEIEEIYIGGTLIHPEVLFNWIINQDIENGYERYDLETFISFVDGPVPPKTAGGGLEVEPNGVTGALDAIKINDPLVANNLISTHGTEVLNSLVLTSFSTNSGETEISYASYVKEITLASAVDLDDIRFSTNGDATGHADLTVTIGNTYSFTIEDFEAGRTINGIGVLDQDLFNQIADSAYYMLDGSGDGVYSALYEGELSFTPGSVSLTQFFEKLNYGSGIIDMTDALTFYGTTSNDTLYGLNSRGDVLLGNSGDDEIYGYGGDDTLYGDNGVDFLYGGDGHDELYGGAGYDILSGGNGDDRLLGDVGGSDLMGGQGDDTYVFTANYNHDYIDELTGEGFDTIEFTSYNASDIRLVINGAGQTTLENKINPGQIIYISAGLAPSGEAVIGQYIERIVFADSTVWDLTSGLVLEGTSANDDIRGSGADDIITGMAGNDNLLSYGGNDIIDGGFGADSFIFDLSALNYTDTIADFSIAENDRLIIWDLLFNFNKTTDSANDWVKITTVSGDTNLSVDIDGAGSVHDWQTIITLSGVTGLNVATLMAGGYLLTGMDTLGTFGDDVLIGRNLDDIINAQAGDDTVFGYGGNDIISGGDGTDSIFGDAGDDVVHGGSGVDLVSGGLGNDILEGGLGNDMLNGGPDNDLYIIRFGEGLDEITEGMGGIDTVYFTGHIDWTLANFTAMINGDHMDLNFNGITAAKVLFGTDAGYQVETIKFNDNSTYDLSSQLWIVQGTSSDETLMGHYGLRDAIYGMDGQDYLYGYGGNDELYGGQGDDYLNGGAGDDFLTGGAGADSFAFDVITLGSIDTVTDFNMGQGDKLDISQILFGYDPLTSAIDDFISFTTAGSNTSVSVDRDGTGSTYSVQAIATLSGVTGFDADTMLANGNLIA